jgi:hypothetical protein
MKVAKFCHMMIRHLLPTEITILYFNFIELNRHIH